MGLRVARSTLPRALYLDMARLTTRGLMRSRRASGWPGRAGRFPVRLALGGEDAGGEDDLVTGGVQGDGEAGAVGSVPGTVPAASAMALPAPGR